MQRHGGRRAITVARQADNAHRPTAFHTHQHRYHVARSGPAVGPGGEYLVPAFEGTLEDILCDVGVRLCDVARIGGWDPLSAAGVVCCCLPSCHSSIF